ncbi:MAG: tRNA (guanosine(37)-N1)-methyltransferase TrmD [Cloacibacillus porcorum]|uniref:tRNA (guanosine(37)-N1)-methyltransferase TrmD n=1 Tax=Cloacibacillus porcorum TaxID=1197717 RepID=UPI00235340DD|nr:tRNA (guanosine(37)-N1)-methyltransferase TrmD [Cloacibacillus porcorum]MCI5866146.1 tRNA (guanosine(37)-N1)-methyltransferase TrmD [Cloacibacillus porcorum]
MKISIITAFPELMRSYLAASVLGRGIAAGKLDVEVIDIRDFAEGDYRQIDDYCYGSGGMMLMAEPLAKALASVSAETKPYVVYPSPQGTHLYQELVEDLSRKENLVIICGHYEGVDERFTQKYVDAEISLGDFVLTGGEMPAMAIVDAVSRLIPGVVGKNSSVTEDSFYSGMLDTPHYTRPAEWRGERVPEVLTNGDAKAIDRWRRRRSVERTLDRRPDVAARAGIMPWLSGGAYVMEVHYPVLDKHGEKSSTAITGMDLHDIARACRTYGIKKYLLVTPLAQQREMAKRIAGHWTSGWGAEYNPDRKEAFSTLKIFASVQKALGWLSEREKKEPFKIATTAKRHAGAQHWLTLKREILRRDHSPVFLFGTGWGLHDEVMEMADVVMTPITGGSDGWNHLSVRSAVSITLDRFFGWR